MAVIVQAQTCAPSPQTMFYQDFENPTSSTLTETVNSASSTVDYSTDTSIGKRSRMVNKKNANIDYGNVDASYSTNTKVSFSFAPQKIDYISDNIKFYISTNGGATWSKELEIYSNNYYTWLFWNFSQPLTYDFSLTNAYTSTYDGDNSPNTLYISDSNKKNKVEISIPNNINRANLRLKFEIENDDSDDFWYLDDIKITGDFIDTKTWNGNSWTGRTTSAPTSTEIVIIDGDYNTGKNGNLNACKCTINSNKTLTIAANSNITLQNDLINNGTITVENNGNLIQVNNNATFTGNNITVKRDATLKRLGYTYWSSPVASQNLKAFSPNTLNNRFYTYNETSDTFNVIDPVANNFSAAKGYALRAPNDFSNTTASTFSGSFVGIPNNGTKTVAITKTGAGYNLIGNPYPSNISFSSFYAANSTLINQSAYFWTNTNANPTQKGGTYSQNNYAIINGTGYTPAQNSSIKPTNQIVVGQGFIVQAKSAGTITFNNSMRTSTSGIFFNSRMANKTQESTNRYWLDLKTPANNFTTILVGYIPGATNDIDEDFDSENLVKGSDDFYTIQNNKNLAIQGRNENFSVTDKVQLGAVMFEAGDYEISIPQKEGIFSEDQDIYLKDKLLNVTVNISEAPYQFSSDSGEINNRFEIVYTPESTLATGNVSKNKETVIYKNAELITIENKINKITSVEAFDATGKLILSAKPNSNQFSIENAKFQKGLVFFKTTSNNKIETKKFLVK